MNSAESIQSLGKYLYRSHPYCQPAERARAVAVLTAVPASRAGCSEGAAGTQHAAVWTCPTATAQDRPGTQRLPVLAPHWCLCAPRTSTVGWGLPSSQALPAGPW